jgi:outer membrane receptor protein involved in Fe transport
MPIDQAPAVETVVVRAINLPPAPGDAAFSIVRLTSADLASSPRLDEALESVPGFSLFRRTSSLAANPTTQGVSLRAIAGSGASRALVTLNGVPQNDPFGGWVIWTGLATEEIDAASVVRGAGAGPYGAGALTGVVALSGRTSAPGGFAGDITYADHDEARGAAIASTDAGPVHLLVGAAAETSAGWIPVKTGAGAADTHLTLHDNTEFAQAQVDVGRAALTARVSAYDEDRGAGLAGAAARARGEQASLTLAAQPTAGQLGWRVQGWLDGSDLRNSSVAVAANRASTTPANNEYKTPAIGYGFNAALRRETEASSLEVGLDLRGARGTDKEQFRFMSGAFTRGRIAGGQTFTGGLYAEASHSTGPWLLTGGVRVDDWAAFDAERIETNAATGAVTLNDKPGDRSGVLPSARVGLRRDLDAGLYLRGAAYAGFRPATLNELHRPFRVGNDVTEANAALKPERLYGVEGGAGQETRNGAWSATVFYNRLEDAILNVTQGQGPGTFPVAGFIPAGGTFFERENAGAVDAWGVEAEAHRRLTDHLSVNGAVDYTDARVDGGGVAPQLTGLQPANTPRVTATAGAVWRPSGRLSLSGDLRYESLRYDDDQNTRRIAPSLSVNAHADWRLSARARAFVAVDNIANAPIETGQTAAGVKSLDAPRTVRVGLSWGL